MPADGVAYVNQWLEETYPVTCFVSMSGKKVFAIALIHKIDFDPLGNHVTAPHVLDYVFVGEAYREEGYALELLTHLQEQRESYELTTFCDSDAAVELFREAGFTVDTWIARSP